MKGLLIKDTYIVLKQLITFIIIITIMLIFGRIINENDEWICTVISYITILCSCTACDSILAEDESSHFNIYTRVLPISRKNVINEKFALSVVINIIYLVAAAVAIYIGIGSVTIELVEFMYINIILTLIISSLVMFFTIKFNARYALLIAVTVFPIIATILISLLGIYDMHHNTTNLLWDLKNVFITISIVIYVLCYYLSSKVYIKKEIA